VIFWSRNNRTVARSAGIHAPHRAHIGRSIKGIHHGLPDVVANLEGSESAGSEAMTCPYFKRATRAVRDPKATPMAGAKLDRLFRIDLVKYTEFFKLFRTVADPNVTDAQVNVNRALVAVVEMGDANGLEISEIASKIKMVLMRTENISSVKGVRNLTIFDAEVRDATHSIPPVHRPVHAYNGKNGKSKIIPSLKRLMENARLGPMGPMS
jgi:hypothetical protein